MRSLVVPHAGEHGLVSLDDDAGSDHDDSEAVGNGATSDTEAVGAVTTEEGSTDENSVGVETADAESPDA
jgi:hypothetical protein